MCSKDFKFLQISVFSVIKLGIYQIKIGICFFFPKTQFILHLRAWVTLNRELTFGSLRRVLWYPFLNPSWQLSTCKDIVICKEFKATYLIAITDQWTLCKMWIEMAIFAGSTQMSKGRKTTFPSFCATKYLCLLWWNLFEIDIFLQCMGSPILGQ